MAVVSEPKPATHPVTADPLKNEAAGRNQLVIDVVSRGANFDKYEW